MFTMSLGPCAPTMDLSRPKAGVSCSQSRGSNGNHDMLVSASGTGCNPVERGQPLAREPRWGHPPFQRIMATRAETSDLAAVSTRFRAVLDALGLAQHRIARLFNVTPRTVRRWKCGARRTPCGVDIVLRLLATGTVTIVQVEQVAVPVPVRNGGGATPEPPAPLVEPATPSLADPGPTTTAEKIYALRLGSCRWPCGDPRDHNFYFCGKPAAEPPYCEQHHSLAYVAQQAPGGGQGVRVGFVTWRRVALARHHRRAGNGGKSGHRAAAAV